MHVLIALEGKLNQGPNIGTKNLYQELSKKKTESTKDQITLVDTTKFRSLLSTILQLNKFDIFHFYSESPGAAFFFLLFKMLGKKTVYTVHGNFFIEAKDKRWPISILWIPAHVFVIKNVEAVIFPTQYLQKQIDYHMTLEKKQKLTNDFVIPNGITIEAYPEKLINEKIKKIHDIQKGTVPLNILSVTSFVFTLKTQGVDLLIQVYELLKKKGIKTKMRIGGIGPKLEAYKKKYQNEQVTFLGYCDNKKENEWADIFIHLSYLDNLPFVILNAEGLGIPTIASDVGGIPEIYQLSQNKHLWGITENTPEIIVQKILDLLQNPTFYSEVSHQQYQNIKNNFDIQKTSQRLWNLYQTL